MTTATQLWAASGRIFEATGFRTSNAPDTENGLASARTALGNDAYDAAWKAGHAMGQHEAIALAIATGAAVRDEVQA